MIKNPFSTERAAELAVIEMDEIEGVWRDISSFPVDKVMSIVDGGGSFKLQKNWEGRYEVSLHMGAASSGRGDTVEAALSAAVEGAHANSRKLKGALS